MPNATITVKYVNKPREGKKLGTIKTPDNQIYGVYPEKLGEFQENGIYDIEYRESQFPDGGSFKTITSAAKKGEAPRPMGRGPMAPRETSMKDAERMFVCSLLNAAITSGKVDFTGAKLEAAVNGLRGVWANTFGLIEASEATRERTH